MLVIDSPSLPALESEDTDFAAVDGADDGSAVAAEFETAPWLIVVSRCRSAPTILKYSLSSASELNGRIVFRGFVASMVDPVGSANQPDLRELRFVYEYAKTAAINTTVPMMNDLFIMPPERRPVAKRTSLVFVTFERTFVGRVACGKFCRCKFDVKISICGNRHSQSLGREPTASYVADGKSCRKPSDQRAGTSEKD